MCVATPAGGMTPINLSFSACGFLGIYHLGAASAFCKHGQKLLRDVKAFAGASAGSLVASVLLTAPEKIEVMRPPSSARNQGPTTTAGCSRSAGCTLCLGNRKAFNIPSFGTGALDLGEGMALGDRETEKMMPYFTIF